MIRKAVLNAGLVLLSMILAVAAAEFVLRKFVPLRDVGPSFTVHDPVLGKRVKASFSTERVTPEFRMRFSTNSLGFRGPEPHSAAAPILFLGDSFTLGYGVNDGEEYPALVREQLRRRFGDAAPPVFNAGIGDSGNGYWIKFLRNMTLGVAPALVVMQVFQNDFADNLNEGLFALGRDGALQELPVPPPGLLRRLQPLIDAIPFLPQSHLVGLVRQVRLPGRGGAEAPALPRGDALTLALIEEAIRICQERGWNALGIVVGLPQGREDAVAGLFTRYGVPAVVLPGKNQQPELYYAIDGHWNAAGHAFAARAVVRAIDRLLPAP